MPNVLNFDNFGDALMRTIDGNGAIILDSVYHGAQSLSNDFTVIKTRDQAALVQLGVKDSWAPASDDFNPKQALEVRSRLATFKEGDIDLFITLSQIKEAYQSYLGWIKTPGLSLNQVTAKPFELFFLELIIQKHFDFVRKKTSWGGVYNQAGTGAASLADGFIKMFTTGRAVGGDILSTHVFDGDTITAANSYAQFNGVADRVAAVNEDLLSDDLLAYCSLTAYDLYREGRQAKYPNFVAPDARPTVFDKYTGITFKVDPGLQGKSTIVITPKKNMMFVCNEDPSKYTLTIIRDVKGWKVSIRASFGFDYASPDWVFLNDNI